MNDVNGRPIYAADSSSTETWEAEALRSQQWAAESRERARRYYRRQLILGWLAIGLAVTLIVAVVAFIVIYATSQR